MVSKKGKAPPNTYEAICTVVDGFWGFVATYFGEDSSIAEDYWTVHQLLDKMTDTHFNVAALNWRVFTWLAINDTRQLFNTIVTEENLLKGRGLAISNMIAVSMINLKTYNHFPEVRGIPAEWYEQERERPAGETQGTTEAETSAGLTTTKWARDEE